MRLADTRPPFAGLAKLPEEALASLPTPCYLLDEGQLRRNGEILLGVQQRTGCKILLAQKAFSNFAAGSVPRGHRGQRPVREPPRQGGAAGQGKSCLLCRVPG